MQKSVFIQDIVMSVLKTDHWDEPVLQSATKHNISVLLGIIEIHKYTSQIHIVYKIHEKHRYCFLI